MVPHAALPIVSRSAAVYERSIDRWRADETISADDSFVLDEVTSAYRLDRVFQEAHPWRGIECGIERAAEEALALNRGADGGDGDDRTDPRHGAYKTANRTAPCVLRDLRGDGHADAGAKCIP